MTDIFHEGDRDACAREAAAAIDAVLDRRCPEMKMAFWRAVEKHYRPSVECEERLLAANLDDQTPARSR
jgi:hypothetical protein